MTFLFVYGTLQRGEPNARWMGGARFVGRRATAAAFTLADLGPYPAMLAHGDTTVQGELYEVDADTLARLDEFEGHPDLYQRTPIRLNDGSVADAYLFAGDMAGARVISSGQWRAFR